jgi:acyl-CoA thioesterase-2
VRDGRSFTTRRVVAVQHGKPIFSLSASFQLDQPGLDHQSDMPDAPPPESLPTLEQRYADSPEAATFFKMLPRPMDLRYVDDPPWQQHANGPRDGLTRVWMRANGRLPDDPLMHVCVLTFASDMTLLDSVLVRHGLAPGLDQISMASLDHAMWFQRPFRADEWMLYVSQSPSASGSRGLATGRFYSQDGRHLASVVQEGMIRVIQR